MISLRGVVAASCTTHVFIIPVVESLFGLSAILFGLSWERGRRRGGGDTGRSWNVGEGEEDGGVQCSGPYQMQGRGNK